MIQVETEGDGGKRIQGGGQNELLHTSVILPRSLLSSSSSKPSEDQLSTETQSNILVTGGSHYINRLGNQK